jgi:Holliday junction resolvase
MNGEKLKCGKQKAEMGGRINSRAKGARAEREFASVLRENGFDARRGQQFAGGADSPDVVSRALAWLHVEVKHVKQLNLVAACEQAERDGGGKPWIVAHRRNGKPWRITMSVETFFGLLKGALKGGNEDKTMDGKTMETDLGAVVSAKPPLPVTENKQQQEQS